MSTVEFSPVHRSKGGRPKGKPAKKNDMSRIIQQVISRKERAEKLAELARGVTVQKVTKKGELAVYSMPPDEKALRQLNEYDMGKPMDRAKIDVTSDGKPVSVALIPPIVPPKDKRKKEEK